jgi:hypothetical protein
MNMVGANALLEIPSGGELLPAGSRVTALLTGESLTAWSTATSTSAEPCYAVPRLHGQCP